jgi:hypothetical protein
VKIACKPREEMSMQGIHKEEVISFDALVEVGVADVGIE